MTENSAVARDNGEIDLRELFAGLWAQRVMIAVVTLVITLAAVAYAFLKTPVYESKASLLPPRLSDIAGFNLGRGLDDSGLQAFSVQDVYAVFTRNLTSVSERRMFFRSVYLPSLPEGAHAQAEDQAWAEFNKVLTVKAPDKSRPDFYEVQVEHSDPKVAAEWANLYVQNADQRALADMQRNVLGEIQTRIRSLKQQIDVLRTAALQRRQDRVAQLTEALAIAEAVEQEMPLVTTLNTTAGGEIAASLDGSLMYMRGARALRAELTILQNRKIDDPFIAELRPLQDQLSFYRAIEVKPDNVAVFTLDSAAEVPETPTKPKKTLVVALGLVLGLMVGVFIALVRFMFHRS